MKTTQRKERTFNIPTNLGQIEVPLVKKFSFYVGPYRYWFAIHRRDGFNLPILAEWHSGLRMTDLRNTFVTVNYAATDPVEIARDWLTKKVAEVGADVMKAKIDAAIAANKINK